MQWVTNVTYCAEGARRRRPTHDHTSTAPKAPAEGGRHTSTAFLLKNAPISLKNTIFSKGAFGAGLRPGQAFGHHNLLSMQSLPAGPALPKKRGRHPRPRPMATALVQAWMRRMWSPSVQVEPHVQVERCVGWGRPGQLHHGRIVHRSFRSRVNTCPEPGRPVPTASTGISDAVGPAGG